MNTNKWNKALMKSASLWIALMVILSQMVTNVNINAQDNFTKNQADNTTLEQADDSNDKNVKEDEGDKLRADVRVIYERGVRKSEAEFFEDVHLTFRDVDEITSNFATAVNMDVIGAYLVTLQGIDSKGTVNVIATLVLITEEPFTIVDETNLMMLEAHDFTIALSTIKSNSPLSDFVVLARAKAWEIRTGQPRPITLLSEKPTTGGDHLITFGSGGAEITITVTVVDDLKPTLRADKSVRYQKGDIKTEANFFKDIHVYMSVPAKEITSDFAEVVDLQTLGVYVVTMNGSDRDGYKADPIQSVVYVTNPDTIIDEDKGVMIDAHDFYLISSEVEAADFIALAQAQAWDTATGEKRDVTMISEKPTTSGVHDVTFMSEDTDITVKAYVYDKISQDQSEGMNAHDFTIPFALISEENFIKYAEAKVYDLTQLPIVELGGVKVTSPLPDTVGLHDVTFESASGKLSMTVKAHIYGAISEDGTEAMNAHDFAIALADVNEANFIIASEVQAYDLTNVPATELDGVKVTSEMPKTIGIHDVTFTTASGKTSITVNVSVFNTVSEDRSEAMDAHDFAIALADVNEENFILHSGVKAYDITSLPAVELDGVKVTYEMPKTTGIHDVTFTSASGKTSITVKAHVYNVVNPDWTEAMDAHDFAIALGDVNEGNFILHAGVKAYDITSLPAVELEGVKVTSDMPKTTGTHDVTFTSASGKTSITVKAHVYNVVNPDRSEAMDAHDFAIALGDVNEANFILHSGVKAYDITSLPAVELDGVKVTSAMPETTGTHDVTFTTASGKTSITVKATVFGAVNPDRTEAMDAHDFAIALGDVNEGNFILHSGVKAYDITSLPAVELEGVKVTSTLPSTIGTHDVTFTSASGKTSITVKATVFGTVNPDRTEAMDANDFAIALADVNEANFILHSGVKAYDITSLPAVELDGVKVTSTMPETTGTHDVTFTSASGKTSITVKATVFGTVNPDRTEAMDAHDFAIALADVNEGNFILHSGVKAYDITSLPAVELDGVKVTSQIPGTTGTHDVTFTTASGKTSITVKATVFDVVSPDYTEAMDAHDFAIALADANEANFILHSGVKAYDITSLPATELEGVKVTSPMPETTGTHDVTFTTASGKTNITVQATVFGTVNPDRTEAMDAHDFAIALADVNEGNFILHSGVKAYDITSLPAVELEGVKVTSEMPKTIGTHDVTFTSASGKTSITVKATVFDTISEDHIEAMNAHDFEISLALVNEANFIKFSEVKAYDITSLPAIELAGVKVTSQMPSTVGTHDVTFTTASGKTSITVKATIAATNIALEANDIVLTLGEAQGATAEDLLTRTDAQATSSNEGATTSVSISAEEVAKVSGLMYASATPVQIIITAEDSAGDSTSVAINVYVYDAVNPERSEAMNAHDFAIALADVNEANFILHSGVIAYDITSLPAVELEGVKVTSPMPNTIGTHDVTFTTASGKTSITVKATVFGAVNPDGSEAMDAHDFAIALADVNEANFILHSGVKAYDITSLPAVELEGVKVTSTMPKTIGTHDVTFTTASSKTSITVKATVFNEVNVDRTEAMDANDFAIALGDVNEANFILHSGVKAYDITSLPPVELDGVKVTSEMPNTTGTHDVTFTTASAKTSITVKATVFDTVNSDRSEAMDAHDFAIALADVNEENFIFHSGVKAYDITGLPAVELEGVKVTSEIPSTVGTHDVTFTSASGKTNITVKAHVYNVVNPDRSEAMDAHDFAIALGDVNEENFILHSGVKAYDITSLPAVELDGVKVTSQMPKTIGTHDVTFTSASGKTSITVKATVFDTVNPDRTEAMDAHDFAIALRDVNETNFIFHSGVKAYDITSLPAVELDGVKVTSEIPNTTGTHDVTFTTASAKTSITVKATVFDTVNPDQSEAMDAHDFAIALADVNEANFILHSGVKAYDITSLPATELEGVKVTSVIPSTTGIHDVTFTSASGKTNIMVKATVFDIVSEDRSEAMNAYDFAIALADVNEANFILHSGVKAYDITSLPAVELDGVKVTSQMPKAIGTHDVTFTTASGKTSITVKATVFNTVNPERTEAMNAHDFAIALGDVNEANFILQSGVKAYDITSLPVVELDGVKVTSQMPKTTGTHDVTFTTASGKTSISVQATVFDVVSEDRSEAMYAHDFAIALGDVNEENFILHSGVKAYDITSLPATELDGVKVTSQMPETIGTHDVTFTSASGKTSITVKATVFNEVNVDRSEAMNARDFIIALADVNEENFILHSGVKAYDITSLPAAELDGVKVTSEMPSTAGTHDVTFTSASGKTSITVKATVFGTVNPDRSEAMDANDFAIALGDVNETNFILHSGVKAYDITSLPAVELEGVKVTSPMPETVGIHDVTFTSASGKTTITVKATVFNEVSPDRSEAMNARDFIIALADVNEANFILHSGVKAYDITSLPAVELDGVKVTSALPATTGTHDVTFTSASGKTSITVKATVFDTVNPDRSEAMDAHDFAIALGDVNEANFILHSGVKAYDITSLPATELEGVRATSQMPETIGTHDVTFTSASGKTSITVEASVFDKISEDRSEAMNAHDFTIALGDVSEANLILAAEAKAYDITALPGVEIPGVQVVSMVARDEHPVAEQILLPVEPGEYAVTFSSASGNTEIMVVATVVADAATIIIEADDVVLTLAEFKQFVGMHTIETEILQRAHAKGYVLETGASVTPLTADVTDLLLADPTYGSEYEVTITPAQLANVTADVLTENVENGTVIKVSIATDTAVKLPVTGESVQMLLTGLLIFSSSIIIMLFLFIYRKKAQH